MTTQDRVNALLEAIRLRDEKLGAEMGDRLEGRTAQESSFRLMRESALDTSTPRAQLTRETIVLRSGRPVLAVSNDAPTLTFQDAESEIWRDRLVTARTQLLPAIRAVGRVELKNSPRFDWVGTGWLVEHDIVVTNRHVALEFGKLNSQGFAFRRGIGGESMSASINFLCEFGREDARAVSVTRILHIEDEDGPDLAFLQVQADETAVPIPLSADNAIAKQMVAVIGYPARDSRIPDQALMDSLFGNVYDKKRLAPGQVIKASADDLEHDCSTLGGNSGSVVLGLGDGRAMGVHFAGRFLEANFAVAANIIAERLEAARSGRAHVRPVFSGTPEPSPAHIRTSANISLAGNDSSLTFTIPIRITLAVDARLLAPSVVPAVTSNEADVPVTEGVVEDYRNRQGYREGFLGSGHVVPLPEITSNPDQVLDFLVDGENDHVLRYQHFSVVMNRKRRMCFFSAVNIDGRLSRKAERTTWRTDPRIPKDLQIMYECYGNPPKFSRGHMTRREDPAWGTSAEAALGNSDSMHVTNVTPQMQSFNAPIWLGLEDYALQSARKDKVRISVITGPILLDNDPVRYGVKIPRAFWKVIAFVHDQTGKLCATGYSISQVDHIQVEEFVYGGYETYQQPLSWIEQQAGVSFGALRELDPLTHLSEALPAPLTSLDQIRFSS